jgi:SpoVK/Ycf46/Vps4 family AAA+-type ATPase
VHERNEVLRCDVADAERILNAKALETRATRIDVAGDWCDLAAAEETLTELRLLASRCRHREQLAAAAGSAGVRALLSGPTGTGKTLAARLLASVLGKDLYAVNVATVIDKYLGETEKNLETLFSRAEEIDVVLLLDEGDALLTRRTDVRTSNDRYANLETNFLLQRLEAFEGILVVTTNAGERIDPAFRRRIDVVIDFKPPDSAERWRIWRLHLPPEHSVDESFVETVASRCALTGGQIRNAVLHAQLLALDGGDELRSEHVEEAVRREYRKAGAICPLRERVGA